MYSLLTNAKYAQAKSSKASSSQESSSIEITQEMSDAQIVELNAEINLMCDKMREIGFKPFENLRHKFTSIDRMTREFSKIPIANYAKNIMQQILKEFQTFSPEKQHSLAESMKDFTYLCGPGSINEMQETINFLKISKLDFHGLIIETKSQIINDLITIMYREQIFTGDFAFFAGQETHKVHKLYNSITAEFLLAKFPLDHDDFAKSDPTPEMQNLIKENIEQKFNLPNFKEFFINQLAENIYKFLEIKQINALSARIEDLKLGITANLLLDISKQKVEFNQAYKEIITEAVRLKLRKLELIPEQNLEFSQQILRIASEASDCGISKETIEKADEKILHFIMQHNLPLDPDECETRNIFEYVSTETLETYIKSGKSLSNHALESIISRDTKNLSFEAKQNLVKQCLRLEINQEKIAIFFDRLINQEQENARDLFPKNTLKTLINKNELELVDKLIEFKINLSEYGNLLIEAIHCRNIEFAEKLIIPGANFDIVNEYGNTALMFAARNGHTEMVDKLLTAKVNVDSYDKNRNTALILAAKYGHTKIVKKLLDAKADVNLFNEDKDTALISAAKNGHTEAVKELLKTKINLNATDKNGNTALMFAIGNDKIEAVKQLLDENADVNLANNSGARALISAIKLGRTKIIILLIAKADVNLADKYGETALMEAAKNGHTEIVEKLLAANANVNLANKYDETALMAALRMGKIETVEQLIKLGAVINKTTFCNALSGQYYKEMNSQIISAYGQQTKSWVAKLFDISAFSSAYEEVHPELREPENHGRGR